MDRFNQQPWRVGRKLGRTIYLVINPTDPDKDILIGVMDTIEFAKHIVELHNEYINKNNGQ